MPTGHPVISAIAIFSTGFTVASVAASYWIMPPDEMRRWILHEDDVITKVERALTPPIQQVTELERELSDTRIEYEKSLTSLRLSEQSLREQNARLTERLDSSQSTINALRSELEAAGKNANQYEDLKAENDDLTERLKRATKQNFALKNDIADLKKTAEAKARDELGSRVSSLEKALDSARSELRQYTSDASNLNLEGYDVIVYYSDTVAEKAWRLVSILNQFNPNQVSLSSGYPRSFEPGVVYYRHTNHLGLALKLRDALNTSFRYQKVSNQSIRSSYEFELVVK